MHCKFQGSAELLDGSDNAGGGTTLQQRDETAPNLESQWKPMNTSPVRHCFCPGRRD